MGYIAPIWMIQYSDYQKRVQEQSKPRDPMPVTFTPRITFQPNFQSGTALSASTETYRKTVRKEEEKVMKNKKFPDQTGKGRYINEYV